MRTMNTIAAARSRGVLGGGLVSLLVGLVALAPAAGASHGPTAVTAKKKCKGPLWRCAPRRYHLSATDTVTPGPQGSITEDWSAEVDLVRIARNFARVDYGAAGGTVTVSGGSFLDECAEGGLVTGRIEPQTIAVPPGPGYPSLGDFGVEFTLVATSGFAKNTYGGPFGSGSGGSSLYVTYRSPCPERPGSYQTTLTAPRSGMEGQGKVGRVLRGSDVFNTIFERHSFSWTLTPKK